MISDDLTRPRDSDVATAFIDAMEAAGIRPTEPILSRLGADLIRFHCDGDRAGKSNGWAVLHLDGRPAGAFGNYRLGISETWRAECSRPMSADARRDMRTEQRRQRAARDEARAAGHASAAEACRQRWARAKAVDPTHPYLVRKRVAGEGLRQEGGRLLVPMCDEAGEIWNLQAIGGDGVKRFAKGGRQQGLFLIIGEPDAVVCVGEGYATSAAVRRATGHAIAVAFSGPNLTATAQAVQALYPDADIIICADDDTHLVDHPVIKRNLGLDHARAAAAAVGGRVAMPPREGE